MGLYTHQRFIRCDIFEEGWMQLPVVHEVNEDIIAENYRRIVREVKDIVKKGDRRYIKRS
ncbi:MAG TPA: hypothetical protein VIH61_09920 [Waddliaceae bacterium]